MADDASLLTDIRARACGTASCGRSTARRDRAAPIAVAQGPRTVVDLATTAGRDNLAQAITMRLLTPRGELAELGHPDYGSRLHELIGRRTPRRGGSLVKLLVLESLAQRAADREGRRL